MDSMAEAAELYQQAIADPGLALARLRRTLASPNDLLRHIAAAQVAFHFPSELPGSSIREMLNTLIQVSSESAPTRLSTEYAEATCGDDGCWDLGQHLAMALARLPAGSADFAVPELVSLWQRDRQFYEAILAAVALSFPESAQPVQPPLSENQRRVLESLVGDEAIWNLCAETVPGLTSRGLPGSKVGISELLANWQGQAEPGVGADSR